jgi:transposase
LSLGRGVLRIDAPRRDLGSELQRITGVNLTRIDGIDVMVAQPLLSEVGMDMSRWNTKAHFSSWLGLCPDKRISGDKLLRKGTRHVVNRAATALRLAARNLSRSRSYLGTQYLRLHTKLGAPTAITAMAQRLARSTICRQRDGVLREPLPITIEQSLKVCSEAVQGMKSGQPSSKN